MQILSEFSLILQYDLYQFLGNFFNRASSNVFIANFHHTQRMFIQSSFENIFACWMCCFLNLGLTAGKDLFKFR